VDNRELPALDGSALGYVLELQTAGTLEQDKEKRKLFLKEAVWCSDKDALLTAIPCENFRISYFLKYGGAEHISQYADFSFDCEEKKRDIFIKEIAPARTFCLETEVVDIQQKDLGKGGSYENVLVLRNGRPLKNEFRFVNELARHKIIDLLGDLFLLNAEIKAHIIGVRSGHALNAKLLKKLEKLIAG
jgi:UDP-3-O-acyl-N-acetylglucosamine deacetylase